MHERNWRSGSWKVLAATLLAAACSDTAGPSLRGLGGPLLAVGIDQQNGTMASGINTTVMAKGFNGDFTNPRHGAAVVATFLWTGPPGIVTSVRDRLANGRPVGNTFHLVESASNGTLSMATYVATNVQGFPSPCCTTAGTGQDTVYVVEAFLSQAVTEGGIIVSSYTGVDTSFTAAFGGHSSATGSGSTTTAVAPGAMPADSGSLVYGIAIASPVSGHSGPGAPFQLVGSGSNASTEADARWAEVPSTGSINPTWSWFFSSPGNWLASGVVLRAAGAAPPPPPPPGNLTATTSTTGSNLDADGYTVTVDGGPSQAIGINGSVTFTGLAAGDHQVALSGVAANCTVTAPNPRTVSVPAGGTATTTFSVSCASTTGDLTATTSTSGSNLDPDGYTVTVDGASSQAIGTNGSVTFTGLASGNHSVQLSGVAGNCTVTSANPLTVSVPSGGTGTAAFTVSCAATTGNLSVSASTTGSSLDPDGYTVTVDGASSQAVAINGTVTFNGLASGNHSVSLLGVAGNCTVSGSNPRTISVPSGGTASTTFSVSCTSPPGNLTANTSTTGSSLDPDGYSVSVDGGAGQAIALNSSFTFTNLSAGNHSVALSGVSSNCTVSGSNPRTVSVPSGGTASTTFSVSCTTPPGNLTVTTTTTGSSLDPDGYTVTMDGGNARAIGINSSTTYTNVSPGNHNVALSGVASNCTVSGGTSRTASVPSGGTATVSYSVSCTTPNTAPVVNAGPDQTALTGLLFTESWSFSDPDNGPWSYTINWGDGTTTSGSKTAAGSFSNGHTYVTILPRTFTIRITVTDSRGASHSDTKVVTVLLL